MIFLIKKREIIIMQLLKYKLKKNYKLEIYYSSIFDLKSGIILNLQVKIGDFSL